MLRYTYNCGFLQDEHKSYIRHNDTGMDADGAGL